MRKFILSLNFFFSLVSLSSQQDIFENKNSCSVETKYRYASSKTDYDLIGNKQNFQDYQEPRKT